MTEQTSANRGAARLRFHWMFIVVLAVCAGCLTVVLAQAQQKATDAAAFRKLLDDYCVAWSTGNADTPAPMYAKDAGLVFYDLAPFAYHGWKEYHEGVKKEFFDSMVSGKLTPGKDLTVARRGNIAWTTIPIHFSIEMKDGMKSELDCRHTAIWERRGGKWLIVHEHVSVPLPGN